MKKLRFFQKNKLILLTILVLSLVLRFYQLENIPPGLDWDEASNIYNGYSLLKTGKDEFSQTYPFLFRAFDGYIPPVLIYLNMFSVAIFGLSEKAARFPNAFLGTITIYGLYLLVYKLTNKERPALLSALFLAISPWHVIYSRVNTLASTPLVFIVFGTYFFLKGLEKNKYFLISLIVFSLGLFSYFSAYIFIPFYVSALLLIYHKKIKLKQALLLLIPIIFSSILVLFILPGGQVRLQGVSLFSDPDVIKQATLAGADEKVIGKIIHNRRLVYLEKILEGYFSSFQFNFLFSKGDAVRRMEVPGAGFGLLYWWSFIFVLLGFYALWKQKLPYKWLFIAWFLLAPIPSVPALPRPVSTRLILLIPTISVISAFGFDYFARSVSKKWRYFLVILLVFNMTLFVHQYFIHFPTEKSYDWFYAYKPLFDFLNKSENQESKVYFVFKQPDYLDQVHIFTVFYNQINPLFYQQSGGTKLGRFGTTGEFSIGRYNFIPDDCKECQNLKLNNIDLLVTSVKKPYPALKVINEFNRQETLYIYGPDQVSLKSVLDSFKEID